MSGTVGKRFGPYVVHKVLRKQGDYVSIFLAAREGSDKPVELHVLTHPVNERSSEFQRFLNEFQTLAALDHPNVVNVIDMGLHDDRAYYATPHTGARPLTLVVHEGRSFSVDEVVNIGIQICEALTYLHAKRVIHRDLGSDSIYWHEPFKRAIVAGFALSKNFRLTNLTARGICAPSQLRVTPEQVEDLPYDERTDLYLVGDMLFWLLTGLPALTPDFSPPSAAAKNDGVSPELDSVLHKVLQASPEKRYQSAREFRDALKDLS